MIRSAFFTAVALLLSLPATAFAQSGPLVDAANEFEGSLTQGTLVEIILGIAQWLLGLLGVVAVIMVLVSAYHFITGGDNEDKIEKAKETLKWALVGVLVATLSFAIVSFTKSFLSSSSGGAGSGGSSVEWVPCTNDEMCPEDQSCVLALNPETNIQSYTCR